ncbi:PH domain-containing protein [Aquibacillus koreensis]|uniref:PH domain-containing protein n=1 Tax=Aquibacillus koreensis TaxID=279446 RepID=A0A9X3WP56_9BACI|nr:PH domain-containing protein [Aquibacillus koreensis]MCT2535147.1 PH domain-containing protein [Aquibacillus koreensis]MDC3421006.1 PH domain-containing protein [Aquibacillus koreensis]
MRQPPKERIAIEAKKAWMLSAGLWSIFPVIITITLFVLAYFLQFSYWYGIGLLVASLIEIILTVFLIPTLRWKRWRYELFDQEIYIQHGVLIVTRTLVPMIRVQHVDTKQGPILKKYGLSSLTISTAATTHEIPALIEEEASALRDQISNLARVDQDDV